MNTKIKDAQAEVARLQEELAAAQKTAAGVPALEEKLKKAESELAKAKEEEAAKPPPVARHPLVWLPLAVVVAAVIVAAATIFRPLPDPIPVTVLLPPPPVVAALPAVTPPTAQRPVARPPAVIPPAAVRPPAAPAPVVPPPVVTSPVVVPPPVVAATPPPPVVTTAAPETGFAVNIFSIREDVRAGEHWLLVGLHFSGDTRSVREWTIRVGADQLPWGPFVPGSYEVRFLRPAVVTTFRPLVRLLSGQEVAGEPVTWTPSR